jgi:DNA polymerase I
MKIRRAFTVFQLMTILEKVRYTLILIEHDPLLYQDVAGMIDLAFQAPSDAAKEASLLLCSPGNDAFLEKLNRNADRVFYLDEGPRASTKLVLKAYSRAYKSQKILETWTLILWPRKREESHLSQGSRSIQDLGALDGQGDSRRDLSCSAW